MMFFEPTAEFIQWLVARANKRIIYDCGSGDGHLLRLLLAKHQRAMGIEPYWDMKDTYDPLLPVLPMRVQHVSALREYPGLIVIARPDHGGWVNELIDLAHRDSEILYIS